MRTKTVCVSAKKRKMKEESCEGAVRVCVVGGGRAMMTNKIHNHTGLAVLFY